MCLCACLSPLSLKCVGPHRSLRWHKCVCLKLLAHFILNHVWNRTFIQIKFKKQNKKKKTENTAKKLYKYIFVLFTWLWRYTIELNWLWCFYLSFRKLVFSLCKSVFKSERFGAIRQNKQSNNRWEWFISWCRLSALHSLTQLFQ